MTIRTCKERFILLIALVLTASWILGSYANLAYSQTIGGVDLSKIPGLNNLTGFNNVPTADNGQVQRKNRVQIMYLQLIMDRVQRKKQVQIMYPTDNGQVQRKNR